MKWTMIIVLAGIGYAFEAINILVANSSLLNTVIGSL